MVWPTPSSTISPKRLVQQRVFAADMRSKHSELPVLERLQEGRRRSYPKTEHFGLLGEPVAVAGSFVDSYQRSAWSTSLLRPFAAFAAADSGFRSSQPVAACFDTPVLGPATSTRNGVNKHCVVQD